MSDSTEQQFEAWDGFEAVRRDPNLRVHLAQEVRTAFERGYDRGVNDGQRMAAQREAVTSEATRPCCNCPSPVQRIESDGPCCGCHCHDRERTRA